MEVLLHTKRCVDTGGKRGWDESGDQVWCRYTAIVQEIASGTCSIALGASSVLCDDPVGREGHPRGTGYMYAATAKLLQSCLTLCDPMDCHQDVWVSSQGYKHPQKSLNKKSHYKVGSRVPRVGTICWKTAILVSSSNTWSWWEPELM